MYMPQSANKNFTAILAGFFLILAVGAITLFNNDNTSGEESAASSSSPQPSEDFKKNRKISPEELSKKIRIKKEITVIDARNEEEYKKRHILDSVYIPLTFLEQELARMNRNQDYAIVDSDGSNQVISFLESITKRLGLERVWYLEGGLQGWVESYQSVISEGDPGSFVDQSKVTYLSSNELKEILSGKQNVLLIDVRKDGQFHEGHLRGAMNIFLEDLEQRRNEIGAGKKIILYDNDGLWAFQGAVRLFDMGYLNVLALSDGLDAWKEKGFEVVK